MVVNTKHILILHLLIILQNVFGSGLGTFLEHFKTQSNPVTTVVKFQDLVLQNEYNELCAPEVQDAFNNCIESSNVAEISCIEFESFISNVVSCLVDVCNATCPDQDNQMNVVVDGFEDFLSSDFGLNCTFEDACFYVENPVTPAPTTSGFFEFCTDYEYLAIVSQCFDDSGTNLNSCDELGEFLAGAFVCIEDGCNAICEDNAVAYDNLLEHLEIVVNCTFPPACEFMDSATQPPVFTDFPSTPTKFPTEPPTHSDWELIDTDKLYRAVLIILALIVVGIILIVVAIWAIVSAIKKRNAKKKESESQETKEPFEATKADVQM